MPEDRPALGELWSQTVTAKESFPGVQKQGAPGGEYYVPTGSSSPQGGGDGAAARPSLDDLYATSKQGTEFLASQQAEPGVNYTKPSPLSVRYNVLRSSNPEEASAYLKGQYGDEGARQDAAGNWLVKETEAFTGTPGGAWVPVFPKGFFEGLGTAGAAAAASAPSVAGGILGGMAGTAAGGPIGGIIGAGAGSGGGKLADEAAKVVQGFSDKEPGEIGQDVAGEAAFGALFQSLPWLKQLMLNKGTQVTSKLAQKIGGVTDEAKEAARSLQEVINPKTGAPFKVSPPIGGVATGLKTFEYDRRLRNMLSKDPMAADRMALIDARTNEILKQAGFEGDTLKDALHQINTRTEALSGREVGERVSNTLRQKQGALLQDEQQAIEQARGHASDALQRLRTLSNQDVGRLGEDVASNYEGVRREFSQDMNAAYNRITRLTGDAPVVDTSAVSREANQLLQTMDPQAVPPIISRLATGGIPMTFEEAHNLRTTLREMARIKDLSPIGQRRGNIRQMAGLVDDAMARAEGEVGQQAAQELRAQDRVYREGIVRFTNTDLNGLIREVRNGRMPNANEVADLLIDKGSTDATRQMWSMLTPDLQARVRTADLRNMFESAAAPTRDGRMMLDGDALMKALAVREDVNRMLYPANFISNLRELARQFQAIDGTLDISQLEPGAVRQALAAALGKRAERDTAARLDPRVALKSNDPEMIDAAARVFMKPRAEEQTLAGQRVLSADGTWDHVQKYALLDLLKSVVMEKPGTVGRTVSGTGVHSYLAQFTPAQQRALFGSRLGEIVKLAAQAKVLFPELSQEMGGSLAAAEIKGNLPKKTALQRLGVRWALGWLADRPTLTKMLVGQMKDRPIHTKNVLEHMMYAASDVAGNAIERGLQRPREPEPVAPEPMGAAQPTFKQFMSNTTPAAPREKSYGGPL